MTVLQDVHDALLAHNDIKPENIIVARNGVAQLCDFGAAVTIDSATGQAAAAVAGSSASNALQRSLSISTRTVSSTGLSPASSASSRSAHTGLEGGHRWGLRSWQRRSRQGSAPKLPYTASYSFRHVAQARATRLELSGASWRDPQSSALVLRATERESMPSVRTIMFACVCA